MKRAGTKVLRDHAATIVAGIVVLVALVAVIVVFGPSPWSAGTGGVRVVIHDGEGNEHVLPLDRDGRLEVRTSLGTNVIVVKDGAARIVEADCPHRSCTQQQAISAPGQQLICLPHQLWVEVTDGSAAEGQLDEDAVTWGDASDVDVVSR